MRAHPRSRSTPLAPGLALALLAACRGAPQPEPAPARAEPAPSSGEAAPAEPAREAPAADPREVAESALAAGDIAATRAALDALVTTPLLESCAAALREGRVEDALAEAERALETSPELPAALFLSGACHASLAERTTEGAERELEAALERLARARTCAGALGTASGIALRLGRLEQALELARAGLAPAAGACAAIEDVAALAVAIEPPERALVRAALSAWRERRATQPAAAVRLFEEAEDALQVALQRTDDLDGEVWIWRTLGEAYLEAGRYAEARATLENGVDRLGRDEGLFALLAEAARAAGGPRAVAATFERVQTGRANLGMAWWYPALEQFRAALRGEGDVRGRLDAAERGFATCRAKDASMESECTRYEVLCRTARGWSWLAEDELERAWGELRAAGERAPGGLAFTHDDPPLASARTGLDLLIEQHLARGELVGAARAAEYVAEAAPDDLLAVRRAAELSRDLGERNQLLERDLKLAARGAMQDAIRLEELRGEIGTQRPGDDLRNTARERDLFFEFGDRRGRAAREAYLRSLEHYRRALELAPDDLRLGYDAGTVVVRRLARRDGDVEVREQVDWAEAQLRRLAEAGRARVEGGFADERARYAFDEAWGDVHQLLGELVLEQRRRPREARAWFERCLEIGPLKRLDVLDTWLPRCDEAERAAAEGRR